MNREDRQKFSRRQSVISNKHRAFHIAKPTPSTNLFDSINSNGLTLNSGNGGDEQRDQSQAIHDRLQRRASFMPSSSGLTTDDAAAVPKSRAPAIQEANSEDEQSTDHNQTRSRPVRARIASALSARPAAAAKTKPPPIGKRKKSAKNEEENERKQQAEMDRMTAELEQFALHKLHTSDGPPNEARSDMPPIRKHSPKHTDTDSLEHIKHAVASGTFASSKAHTSPPQWNVATKVRVQLASTSTPVPHRQSVSADYDQAAIEQLDLSHISGQSDGFADLKESPSAAAKASPPLLLNKMDQSSSPTESVFVGVQPCAAQSPAHQHKQRQALRRMTQVFKPLAKPSTTLLKPPEPIASAWSPSPPASPQSISIVPEDVEDEQQSEESDDKSDEDQEEGGSNNNNDRYEDCNKEHEPVSGRRRARTRTATARTKQRTTQPAQRRHTQMGLSATRRLTTMTDAGRTETVDSKGVTTRTKAGSRTKQRVTQPVTNPDPETADIGESIERAATGMSTRTKARRTKPVINPLMAAAADVLDEEEGSQDKHSLDDMFTTTEESATHSPPVKQVGPETEQAIPASNMSEPAPLYVPAEAPKEDESHSEDEVECTEVFTAWVPPRLRSQQTTNLSVLHEQENSQNQTQANLTLNSTQQSVFLHQSRVSNVSVRTARSSVLSARQCHPEDTSRLSGLLTEGARDKLGEEDKCDTAVLMVVEHKEMDVAQSKGHREMDRERESVQTAVEPEQRGSIEAAEADMNGSDNELIKSDDGVEEKRLELIEANSKSGEFSSQLVIAEQCSESVSEERQVPAEPGLLVSRRGQMDSVGTETDSVAPESDYENDAHGTSLESLSQTSMLPDAADNDKQAASRLELETGCAPYYLRDRLGEGEAEEDDVQMTPLHTLLHVCDQQQLVPWSKVFSKKTLVSAKKLGEGVYGEVFRMALDDQTSVAVKIIPIEGSFLVNDERQKTCDEILPEILIAKEMSDLATRPRSTKNFVQVHDVHVVTGAYPRQLQRAWDTYNATGRSENDHPSVFPNDQLFVAIVLADAGCELEQFQFSSPTEACSVIGQLILALAVAESELCFEHRDLHIGNVLLRKTDDVHVTYMLDGMAMQLLSFGLHVHIIDFTNSRLTKEGCTLFTDLSTDDAMFEGHGDYQFDIYRMMKERNQNEWKTYHAKSNVFWLHYVCDKLCNTLLYNKRRLNKWVGSRVSPANKLAVTVLKALLADLLAHDSSVDVLLNSQAFDSLLDVLQQDT